MLYIMYTVYLHKNNIQVHSIIIFAAVNNNNYYNHNYNVSINFHLSLITKIIFWRIWIINVESNTIIKPTNTCKWYIINSYQKYHKIDKLLISVQWCWLILSRVQIFEERNCSLLVIYYFWIFVLINYYYIQLLAHTQTFMQDTKL